MAGEASSPDIWVNIGGIIAAILAGVAGYFGRSLIGKEPPKADPVLTGIGLALGDKEQTERLLAVLERMANALEAMADRKQADMHDTLEELLEAVKPKPKPPRRRT